MLVEMTLPETDNAAQAGGSSCWGPTAQERQGLGEPSPSAPPGTQTPPASTEPRARVPRRRPGSRRPSLGYDSCCVRAGPAKLAQTPWPRGLCGRGREPAAQPHLSRPGPWGGVSHLCWSRVRFLSPPDGRSVQGPWAPGQRESPPGLPGSCQTGNSAGKGQAGILLARPGGRGSPRPSAPSCLLRLGQWPRLPHPGPRVVGKQGAGHFPTFIRPSGPDHAQTL